MDSCVGNGKIGPVVKGHNFEILFFSFLIFGIIQSNIGYDGVNDFQSREYRFKYGGSSSKVST